MTYNLVDTVKSNASAIGHLAWNNVPYFVAPVAAAELWGMHAAILVGSLLWIGVNWVETLTPKGTTIHMHVDGDVDLTDWKAKV